MTMLRTALSVFLVLLMHFEPDAVKAEDRLWKETAVLETPGWLPGSVAYSSDGKMMIVGGTYGKVIAVDTATRALVWKADVRGDFAGVAFTADGKSIVATFNDGVRFINAATGELENSIEEPDSRPLAVGVFADQSVGPGEEKFINHKIIFGNARESFVKTWIVPEQFGTIQLNAVAKDKAPADPQAVPLAVDPAGRSVILTGPIERGTGKNVLWAWVAGNYEEGSPGNRLLPGHPGIVVSAAWSQDGKIAVTGDSKGTVIVWDATAMKETRRLELGNRVAALAISSRGESIAAFAIGKQAEVYVWETASSKDALQPMFIDKSDFSGSVQACLAFSPDGRQLAGSAFNKMWLSRLGELAGKLRAWELENPKP
jgi:WD40 repeat protein